MLVLQFLSRCSNDLLCLSIYPWLSLDSTHHPHPHTHSLTHPPTYPSGAWFSWHSNISVMTFKYLHSLPSSTITSPHKSFNPTKQSIHFSYLSIKSSPFSSNSFQLQCPPHLLINGLHSDGVSSKKRKNFQGWKKIGRGWLSPRWNEIMFSFIDLPMFVF